MKARVVDRGIKELVPCFLIILTLTWENWCMCLKEGHQHGGWSTRLLLASSCFSEHNLERFETSPGPRSGGVPRHGTLIPFVWGCHERRIAGIVVKLGGMRISSVSDLFSSGFGSFNGQDVRPLGPIPLCWLLGTDPALVRRQVQNVPSPRIFGCLALRLPCPQRGTAGAI